MAALTFDQLDELELNEYCAAMEQITSLSSTDHDLLIRLTVLAEISQREVGEIRSAQGTHATSIEVRLRQIDAGLEKKADRSVVEQLQAAFEKKADRSAVEQLQQFRWMIVGAAGVISIATEFIWHLFKS